MLQRVQSLFLLGVAISMILILFFPIWEEESETQNQETTLDAYALTLISTEGTDPQVNQEESGQVQEEENAIVIAILAVVAAITAFYEIFKYKTRLTQMKLGALNNLLILGVLGASWYYSFQGEEYLPGQGSYEIGFFLPAIAILFNILANRYIRRDEKLVRSVDRLR